MEPKAIAIDNPTIMTLCGLLEILFPDTLWIVNPQGPRGSYFYIHNGEYIGCHWYELCMENIPARLEEITGISREAIVEGWFYNKNCGHLVDYLIKFFKDHDTPFQT